jgi:hypothetical protein
MKLILLYTIIITYINAYSQPEFKIKMDYFDWQNPRGDYVDIKITFKIKNIGNESGYCNEFFDINLFTSDINYSRSIEIIERSSRTYVKPNDYIFSFIIFKVNKNADNLTLKLSESYEGSEKFVTKSYYKHLDSVKIADFDRVKEEAESLFRKGKYKDAATKYLQCILIDENKKNEINIKISSCYERNGDDIYKTITNNNIEIVINTTIDNYKMSFNYDNSKSYLKQKIARLYEELGDYYMSHNYQKAESNYTESLIYYESKLVRDKIDRLNNIKEKEITKELEIQKKEADLDLLNILIEPKTGVLFKGGLGQHNNSKYISNITFWNLELGIPVKLFTTHSVPVPLNGFLNFDLGYSGVFSSTSTELTNYFGLNNSSYSVEKDGESIPINEFYLNAGFGLSILNKYVTPLFCASIGLYTQSYAIKVKDINSSYITYFNDEFSKINIGFGYKFDIALKIGGKPGFYVGYTYKNYNINSKYSITSNNFNANYFSIGVINF